MNKSDVLQRVPLEDVSYIEMKGLVMDGFNLFLNEGYTIRQCVNGTFYHHFDFDMDQNGMDKFVCMISGMLFQIEHGKVDPDLAYGTNYDINDFETGNYDDLFTKEDLKLLKADIAIIKEYLDIHPELKL